MKHTNGTATDEAETAALVVEGSQPVWMILNAARERAFTGEIVFETDPEVLAYLDNGVVYYAERATDVALGRRLLDAGVIDVAQLERGMVRVGDIEHLGRLFDRDSSVDRDAVVVVAESSTHELIAQLANEVVTTARVTAYRHHPSGLHRWFVAPLKAAAVAHPMGAVAQLDTTVVDQLPGLPFTGVDELSIEWDDVLDDAPELHADVFELSLDLAEFTDDVDGQVDVDLDHLVGLVDDGLDVVETDRADARADADDVSGIERPTVEDTDCVDADADTLAVLEALQAFEVLEVAADDAFEFSVVWPDGTEQSATAADAYVEETALVDEALPIDDVREPEAPAAGLVESSDGDIEFTMPPLTLDSESSVSEADGDVDVADDVADAVRRAIAAIESAAVAPEIEAGLGSSTHFEIAEVEIVDEMTIIDEGASRAHGSPAVDAAAPAIDVAESGADAFGFFAPPTMATRAEVLYGQMTEDGSITDEFVDEFTADDVAMSIVGESLPTGGVASVVFVDEPINGTSGGGDDRSSALRRLIGSLRRKDH